MVIISKFVFNIGRVVFSLHFKYDESEEVRVNHKHCSSPFQSKTDEQE